MRSLKFSRGSNTKCSKSECYDVQILNGSDLECLGIAIAMVLTIEKPNFLLA